ncbi:hypothetical protein, partial [Amycolatopsis sp. NPDC004378]
RSLEHPVARHAAASRRNGTRTHLDTASAATNRIQDINDYNLDVSVRFRMRDAVATKEGYRLPLGAFELVDMRSENRKAQDGDLPAVGSIVLSRARKRPIDF